MAWKFALVGFLVAGFVMVLGPAALFIVGGIIALVIVGLVLTLSVLGIFSPRSYTGGRSRAERGDGNQPPGPAGGKHAEPTRL